jgi:hypothetical protein
MLPSIQALASRARDISKYQGISMLNAIRSVAEESGVASTNIAKELSRRGVLAKKKKKAEQLLGGEIQKKTRSTKPRQKKVKGEKNKPDPEDAEHDWILTLSHKRRNLGCALHREREMQRGFKYADHMDDY